MNFKNLTFKKRDEYLYLKSHIFSYIEGYVLKEKKKPPLPVMNRRLLNANKSWICIDNMHCQFVTSHSKCQLGFKVLSLNTLSSKPWKITNLNTSS
jgi:hypothetical protein